MRPSLCFALTAYTCHMSKAFASRDNSFLLQEDFQRSSVIAYKLKINFKSLNSGEKTPFYILLPVIIWSSIKVANSATAY